MVHWVAIVGAVITGVVGPMVVLWQKHRHDLTLKMAELRAENTEQHAEGRQLLSDIHGDLKQVHRDLGKIDEKQDNMTLAVEAIKGWVHNHEIRHLVTEMDGERPNGTNRSGGTNRPNS
jgi:uncharacterized protein HemX